MELRISDYQDYLIALKVIKKHKRRMCYSCNKRVGVIELQIDADGVKDLFCGICAGIATES